MTWKDLIRLTLADLRVYGTAATPGTADEDLALDRLNLWLDQCKTQGLAAFEQARTTWALTAAASYTVGAGATVNVPRPVNANAIAGFAYVNTNLTPNVEVSLGIPMTRDQYDSIAYKSFQSPYPSGMFYMPTFGATGFGTVYPWPIPTTSNLLGVMYSDVQIDEVTNRNATISLPPGYRLWYLRALKLELRDAFRVAVPETTLRRWVEELDMAAAAVKVVNEQIEDISFGDAGVIFGRNGARRGPANIYTGE